MAPAALGEKRIVLHVLEMGHAAHLHAAMIHRTLAFRAVSHRTMIHRGPVAMPGMSCQSCPDAAGGFGIAAMS